VSFSILIPIYNKDVTLLVSSLAQLIAKEKVVSEIILLDDASNLPKQDLFIISGIKQILAVKIQGNCLHKRPTTRIFCF